MVEKDLLVVSLNTAGDSHLETVGDFLTRRRLDVVLLQEVFEDTFEHLRDTLQAEGVFAPLMRDGRRNWGLAILSRYPIAQSEVLIYAGDDDFIPQFALSPGMDSSVRRGLLVAELDREGERFRFVTTKFTWTPESKITLGQRVDFGRMIELLDRFDHLVLAGDFNTPRGGYLFDELALRYKDNIPLNVTTTLDPILHQSNGVEVVVDGLFTTQHYLARDVEIVCGLSDHCAVVGRIQKDDSV